MLDFGRAWSHLTGHIRSATVEDLATQFGDWQENVFPGQILLFSPAQTEPDKSRKEAAATKGPGEGRAWGTIEKCISNIKKQKLMDDKSKYIQLYQQVNLITLAAYYLILNNRTFETQQNGKIFPATEGSDPLAQEVDSYMQLTNEFEALNEYDRENDSFKRAGISEKEADFILNLREKITVRAHEKVRELRGERVAPSAAAPKGVFNDFEGKKAAQINRKRKKPNEKADLKPPVAHVKRKSNVPSAKKAKAI